MNVGVWRWLVRDVFLRARASGFGIALAAASLTAAGVTARAGPTAVELGFAVAGLGGVLAAVLATAGFLPAFLEPRSATVVLCKPPGRATLLLGRSLGVTLFVTLHAGVFVAATGLALGLAAGVWAPGYWLAWPLLVVQFLPFFAASALAAVSTRSTVAAMLAGGLFWLVSWGVNFGRQFLAGVGVEGPSREFGRVVEFAYQLFPKPADLSLLLYDALGVRPDGFASLGLRSAQELGLYSPLAAVGSSVAVAAALFGLAVYELNHQDY